jgi:hypothetical protein
MIEQYGEVKYFDGKQLHKREMTDDELKCMMGHIQLNRGFSLPDQLLSDFLTDGLSKPTLKNCVHFNKSDFKKIVEPLKRKNIRKQYPKMKTHKKGQKRKIQIKMIEAKKKTVHKRKTKIDKKEEIKK